MIKRDNSEYNALWCDGELADGIIITDYKEDPEAVLGHVSGELARYGLTVELFDTGGTFYAWGIVKIPDLGVPVLGYVIHNEFINKLLVDEQDSMVRSCRWADISTNEYTIYRTEEEAYLATELFQVSGNVKPLKAV